MQLAGFKTHFLKLEFRRISKGFLITMWLFAMKAVKLPTHCKATKDTEMDDFGSVTQFFLCYYFSDTAEEEENHNYSLPTYDHIRQVHSKWINLKTGYIKGDLRSSSFKDFNKLTPENNLEATYSQLQTILRSIKIMTKTAFDLDDWSINFFLCIMADDSPSNADLFMRVSCWDQDRLASREKHNRGKSDWNVIQICDANWSHNS